MERSKAVNALRGRWGARGYAERAVHNLVDFFRRNPQALVLLVVCIVLGMGTFIAILIAIATSRSHTGPGYPSGAVTAFQALTGVLGR
jgi:hypothetical protein